MDFRITAWSYQSGHSKRDGYPGWVSHTEPGSYKAVDSFFISAESPGELLQTFANNSNPYKNRTIWYAKAVRPETRVDNDSFIANFDSEANSFADVVFDRDLLLAIARVCFENPRDYKLVLYGAEHLPIIFEFRVIQHFPRP